MREKKYATITHSKSVELLIDVRSQDGDPDEILTVTIFFNGSIFV